MTVFGDSMAHSIGVDIGAFRLVLIRGLIVVVVFFAGVYFLAFLMAGVGQSKPVPVPVASYDAAQVAHCSQFVELARAKFGPEWKHQLDPGDTACAQQIQEAWERDWNPREALPEPVRQPKMIASTAPAPKIAPPEPGPALAAETYSLVPVTGADAGSAGPAGQEAANDSSYSSELGHPSDATLEDGDESGMANGEQGHDARSFSASDYGTNDDQADATRALNNAQLGRLSRADDDPH